MDSIEKFQLLKKLQMLRMEAHKKNMKKMLPHSFGDNESTLDQLLQLIQSGFSFHDAITALTSESDNQKNNRSDH